MVDQLLEGSLLAHQRAVLTDTVIDNDGIVDGVAQNGQHGRNEVAVQRGAQEHEGAEHHHQVVQQGQNGHHAAGQATDLLEADADVQQDQDQRKDHRDQTLLQELGTHGSADVAERELGKGVVRVRLVQGVQQVFHLIGGHGLVAGHRDLQGLLARGDVLAALQGQVIAAQRSGSGLLHLGGGELALIAQGDHGTTGELGIQTDAEPHGTEQDSRHQAGGKGQETLAQRHKVDGLLLCGLLAGLVRTIEPRVPQSLEGRRTADHHTGRKNAEDEVQQHAGEQRVAEGVDRTCRGRTKGKEHKVQGLGEETIRRAEGAHQDDGDDDDGHVAVDDGGQTAGKAALEGTVQRFAAAKLFLDALGRDDVGINAHADGKDDARDAGQRQGEALKHGEVTGDKGQRSSHLTGQRDARKEAGQTVQHRHQDHDEGKGDEAGQHHGAQAVLTEAGADGRIAVHRQRKRQRAGVDLARHLDHILLREGVGRGAGDDGGAIGDGRIDGCRAHVLIVQPDADGAAALVELGGGITKGFGTFIGELEGDVVFRRTAVHRAILRRSALDHGAVQDQLAVRTASLPEGQIGGGADLFDGRFGVEIRLAGLPREFEDQPVGVIVHVQLVVGHIQGDQTVLNDELRGVQLVVGGIVAVRRSKRHVDAAFDIHAEADILRALDVGLGHIAILDRNAKERRVDERRDQEHRDNKLPCFAFSLHKNRETSKYNKPPPCGNGCRAGRFSTTGMLTPFPPAAFPP